MSTATVTAFAASVAAQNKPAITLPAILTANTYFWTPNTSAGGRRSTENKRQNEVADFLTAIGMTVTRSGDEVKGENESLQVAFSYSETCGNIYKHLTVTRNVKGEWKNSNVTSLRKFVETLNA